MIACAGGRESGLTIYPSLELLPANLAGKLPCSSLLIQLHSYGIFMVAEQACKCRGQSFSLKLILSKLASLSRTRYHSRTKNLFGTLRFAI